jgi:cysteine desulfurase
VTRIYLDHNATTPLSPPVIDGMVAALHDVPGNASSVHHFGQLAKAALDDARASVAALMGAEPAEIVLLGSGSESDNLAIRGVADGLEASGRTTHLIASSIEHEAVLTTLRHLARRGWRTTLLPVGTSGVVEPDALAAALEDDTALVSVMLANNEIGTVQPVAELATLARARGALFHTDAVQAAGKIPIDVSALGVDLLSISAHKFYGPKGAGALWVRRGLRLQPQITGGRPERGRRAATENVPGLVGMGIAADEARHKLEHEGARLCALRDRLERGVLASVSGTRVNGRLDARVPNTTNVSFDRVEAESLLIALDLEGIAVSTGSACSSGTLEPSHVLRAMGFPPHRTQNSIRFSLGATNTEAEVDRVVEVLPGLVDKLRSLTRAPVRA